MIDRGAAFGSAAMSVALAMLIAFLFFYSLYLKRYRSGSKGTAAKICLLLGAVSAFFIFQGASMILNELIHSKSVGISVREDKIYNGLLLFVPVVVVSVVTWIVGFFDSSGNGASFSSESSSIAPKPTVDQQIFKSDLIFYALIASAIILFAVVPNWEQISKGSKSGLEGAKPSGSKLDSSGSVSGVPNSPVLTPKQESLVETVVPPSRSQADITPPSIGAYSPRADECVIEALSGSVAQWSGNRRSGYVFYEVDYYGNRFLVYEISNLLDAQIYAKIAGRQDQIKSICGWR